MGFTEPDSPPPPGGIPQMPQASMPGIAPVPYSGPDESPEPPPYAPMPVTFATPTADVLAGAAGGLLQESGYAHDVNAGLVASYVPGSPQPVAFPGGADAGGRDDVSGTVAGAVTAAEARYLEHASDATQAGPSHIGDALGVPVETVGNFQGAFYDPPRDYGAH